jgi:D-alanine-D-alanine ligase
VAGHPDGSAALGPQQGRWIPTSSLGYTAPIPHREVARKRVRVAGVNSGVAQMNHRGPWRACVLLGGETGEREVSLCSGAAVAEALLRRGHSVQLLDPATGRSDHLAAGALATALIPDYAALPPDPGRLLSSLLELDSTQTDLVVIILHGGAGEGGLIQAVLELRGIPYTGSGPGPSNLAMDKVLAKRIFRAEGIPVAEEFLWKPWGNDEAQAPCPAVMEAIEPPRRPSVVPPLAGALDHVGGYPVVVKPIAGGSTVGLTIVRDASQWEEAAAKAAGQIDPERGLLVERFIPGREITVGILEDRALPVVEIVPRTGFYDYQRKYTKGETDYQVPADLPERLAARLQDRALGAYRALGCRDMARVDFRLDPGGSDYCLELNTIPGMTATSLLPMAASAIGIAFDELVEILCRRSLSRGRRLTGRGRENPNVS